MPCKLICLPDFIIIGANKAGTTSVANYLNMHPEIHISRVKEPMFFSSDADTVSTQMEEEATLARPFCAITLDEYSGMLESSKQSARKLGEASTAYLANPNQSARLMKKIVPEIKIIAILREPTERAISAYKMCLGNGIEQRSFTEVVENSQHEKVILPGQGVEEYIRNGLYAQLLVPFYKYFRGEQILLLDYERLKYSPSDFMNDIYHFLQVDPMENDFEKKYNTESDNLKEAVTINTSDIDKLRVFYREDKVLLKQHFGFEFCRDDEWH